MSDEERIARAASVPHDFDGRGAEPPNAEAVRLARRAAELFRLPIQHIDPSTDAGICLSIRSGRRYADIELFNDGQVLTATSVDGESPVVESWSEHAMEFAVRKIESYVEER